MATNYAYPVLRTADRHEALAVGRELRAVAEPGKGTVSVSAAATEYGEWRRIQAALPGSYDSRGMEIGSGIPVDACGHRAGCLPAAPYHLPGPPLGENWQCLPVEVILNEAPLDSVEDAFVDALGRNPATLEWWPLVWPAVPELGIHRYAGGYASVEIGFNSRGLYLEEPSEDHTVYVLVQSTDLARATWIAERTGRRIIGEPLFSG